MTYLLIVTIKYVFLLIIIFLFVDWVYLVLRDAFDFEMTLRHQKELILVNVFLLSCLVVYTIYSLYNWYNISPIAPPNKYYINYLTNLEHTINSWPLTQESIDTVATIFIRERDHPEYPITPEEIALLRKRYAALRSIYINVGDYDIIEKLREYYKKKQP